MDVGPTGLGVITGLGAGFVDLDDSIRRHRDLDYSVLEADPGGLLGLVPPTWAAVEPLLPDNSPASGATAS